MRTFARDMIQRITVNTETKGTIQEEENGLGS
jgi:hypothetical protein